VIIHWQNIEQGNVSVFTHKKHNKIAPVPCTQITHTDITFTPHPVTIMYSSNGCSNNVLVLQK
jgi:hypothetical protein